MELRPVALKGRLVALEPLEERQAPDPFEVMQDEKVCRYLVWDSPAAIEEILALIREAKELMAWRQSIVLAQVWDEKGRAIGSTRLLDARPKDRRAFAITVARSEWDHANGVRPAYLHFPE